MYMHNVNCILLRNMEIAVISNIISFISIFYAGLLARDLIVQSVAFCAF